MKNSISTNINDYIVRNNKKEWQPLVKKDIHYEGISIISLHYDEAKQRSTTILLNLNPVQLIHIIIIPAAKKFMY